MSPLSSPKLSDPAVSLTHATVPHLPHSHLAVNTSQTSKAYRLWHRKRDRSARRAAEAISQVLMGSAHLPLADKREPSTKVNQPGPVDLNSLKTKLLQPKLARSIVHHLKRSSGPPSSSPSLSPRPRARGICLNVSDESLLLKKFNVDENSPAYLVVRTALAGPGEILGELGESTGTFGALAGLTTELIETSGVHDGLVPPPLDRLSVLVC